MDDRVLNAMAKWPDVPAVYGYIGVDRRGNFWLQGDQVKHQRTVQFIARNYQLDDVGRAFFQNGPQRVYADLQVAPWIFRVDENGAIHCHTHMAVTALQGAWITPDGTVVLSTEHGPGVVHDQDLVMLMDHLSTPEGIEPFEAIQALQDGEQVTVRLGTNAGTVTLEYLPDDDFASHFGLELQPDPGDDSQVAVSPQRPAWRA